MLNNEETISDQEGFYPSYIQIRHSDTSSYGFHNTHNNKSFFNKWAFEVRYLPWTGAMQKQPPEIFNAALQTNQKEEEIVQQTKRKCSTQDHPYNLYASNPKYFLVYKRYNDEPIKNETYFINNFIKLQHIGCKKKVTQFKRLRNEIKDEFAEIKAGTLLFNSRFECGNLHCAYKLQKTNEYILFIENDTNTRGYNQWFYFSIQNNQANIKYTFKIVNFKKPHSFFQSGCKPAIFSMQDNKANHTGWKRIGKNITYEQSPICLPDYPNFKFYCLCFDLTLQHQNDCIFIAMNMPYSYTKLVTFLKEAEAISQNDKLLQFNVKSLCRSVCGSDIPEVTITRKSEQQNKKMIVILARQHPVQVWSSYMVEGMIKYLISKPDQNLQWLLQTHIIKIFPMINVDGVVYGNSRCDITGVDLNRRWRNTSKFMHPQIYQIKKRIISSKSSNKIQCCFDLHGHSKKYNIFAYACKTNEFSCRILPLLISNTNQLFDFPSCTFGLTKHKQSTARVWISKILKSQNVLTIQTSFFASNKNNTIQVFSPQLIFKMGKDIITACTSFLDKKSVNFINVKKEVQNRINQFNHYDKINQENSGSQSQPQIDQIDLQTKMNTIFNKTLIQVDEFITNKFQKLKNQSQTKPKQPQQFPQIKSKQLEPKNSKDLSTMRYSPIKQSKISPSKTNIQTLDEDDISLAPLNIPKFNFHKKNKRLSTQQKCYQFQIKNQMQISTQINKQKKMSMHNLIQPKTQRKPLQRLKPKIIKYKPQQTNQQIIIKQYQSAQHYKNITSKRKDSNQLIKKPQKFIPNSMAIKNRANMTLFEQSLYNQDQSNLISKLLQNKKRIDLQKLKREVEKSTSYTTQQKGRIKNQRRQQKIVDYKTFKQNQKINKQIRKLTNNTKI